MLSSKYVFLNVNLSYQRLEAMSALVDSALRAQQQASNDALAAYQARVAAANADTRVRTPEGR
jgi:hypothetical protein